MSARVFFDCEFTDLAPSASLVSAGFCAEGGGEFYAELADFDVVDCNAFVRATVLPLLNRPPVSTAAFVASLTRWLDGFGRDVLLLADSDWDQRLLAKTFAAAGSALPSTWGFRKAPDHLPGGLHRRIFSEEWPAYFLRHPEDKPHHALSDARALRQACLRAEMGD